MKEDLKSGKHSGIVTRFPPEPNGYLHIGHAKSICVNFGLGEEFSGITYMRFDDTNPAKEKQEYIDGIQEDVRWLGFDWGSDKRLTFASDYFDQFHDYAVQLIRKGLAYVDSLDAEQMREYRGTLTKPGKDSPYRTRTVEENEALFAAMTAGEMEDGEAVLRLKIDNSSPNINMRDPAIYRIKKNAVHPQTGTKWNVYPMYDYAHVLTDALEGITHSLCTLEFEDHRPLYEWVLSQLPVPATPRQIEFSRLNLQYTVVSKRKLLKLVDEGHVEGWDDPRMPTLCGLRRRGLPPEALRLFVERTGVSKADNNIDYSILEDCVREVLDPVAPRAFAVLDPIRVVVTDWPEGKVDNLEGPVHPKMPELGMRSIPFDGKLLIEREDFSEEPPPKYFRLKPGGEVRLRYGYVIRCEEVIKDEMGHVVELRCTHDAETRQGAGKKVKGIIHWVSEAHSTRATVKLYDRLFSAPQPGADHEDGDFLRDVNPHSLKVVDAAVEASVDPVAVGRQLQFERNGYFAADKCSTKEAPVFNRVVTLRDTWANDKPAEKTQKQKQKQKGAKPKKTGMKPVTPEMTAAIEAAAAEVRRLKENEGLGNKDPKVVEAVEALLKAKSAAGL